MYHESGSQVKRQSKPDASNTDVSFDSALRPGLVSPSETVPGENAVLGTIESNPSPSFKNSYSVTDLIGDSVLMGYCLQSASRRLLIIPRTPEQIEQGEYNRQEAVCGCCRQMVPFTAAVEVVYNGETERARFGNLKVCKSVWMCQVCARRIGERRRDALKRSTAQWRFEGGIVVHAAFTQRHHITDKLPDLLKVQRKARSLMFGGKAWDKFAGRWGIRHSAKSLENTHSYQNGHHPHMHALFYLLPGISTFWQVWTPELTAQFQDELRRMWQKRVTSAGVKLELTASADYEHGVKVSDQNAYIDEYIAKFGYEPVKWGPEDELTRQTTKLAKTDEHRSMKQLLFDYLMGDDQAGQVWKEFALAFKGERQLFTSQGFGDYFGVAGLLNAKLDGEAPDGEQDVTLARIHAESWRLLLRYGATQGREIRAELLNVASTGSPDALADYLEKLAVAIAETMPAEALESDVTAGASHFAVPPEQSPAAGGHTSQSDSVTPAKPVTVQRYDIRISPPGGLSLPLFVMHSDRPPPAAGPPANENDVNTE